MSTGGCAPRLSVTAEERAARLSAPFRQGSNDRLRARGRLSQGGLDAHSAVVQDSYHAHLLMQVLLSNLVRARATRGCVTGRAASLGAAAATRARDKTDACASNAHHHPPPPPSLSAMPAAQPSRAPEAARRGRVPLRCC
jgi:hypothetical protein